MVVDKVLNKMGMLGLMLDVVVHGQILVQHLLVVLMRDQSLVAVLVEVVQHLVVGTEVEWDLMVY